MTDFDELSVLFPAPAAVEAAGERLEILPLKVRHLGDFARAVRPLLAEYNAQAAGGKSLLAWFAGLSSAEMADLIASHIGAVCEAVAIATEKPSAWVGDLYADDLLRLVFKVIEVNADFFAQRLIPVIVKPESATEADAGPTPSTASWLPDTATPAATP
jgi:hypothetical protein